MSDLVLVFFDARHPEPGAMRDTLEHLVKTNIGRNDSDKILYILNQIDTSAQEDNPEEVIGAWQRALSQEGLIGGSFYTIYNESLANVIEDSALAERFKRKKDKDLQTITMRMQKISTERAYRIANSAQEIADRIENEQIPALKKYIKAWRAKVVIADVVILGGLFSLLGWVFLTYANIATFMQNWLLDSIVNGAVAGIVALIIIFGVHYTLRNKLVKWDAKRLARKDRSLANALLYNNRFWRGMYSVNSRGWNGRTKTSLNNIKLASKKAIQKLTDQFADPSGQKKLQFSMKRQL